MKIVKIRNKHMFECNNPKYADGVHYYAMYWNKKSHKYNAIRLTHVAKKDEKRYSQADKGIIKTMRFKKMDKYADTGITKYRYTKDVNGNNLSPKLGVVVVDKVPSYTSKKIKGFIK